MNDFDKPVVVVVPGDLHLTEPGLENVRAAHQVVDDVNTLIRPDFVQFIGDNVQDATEDQFQLFDQIRGRLDVPHFALVGDHDIKNDPERDRVPPSRWRAIRRDELERISVHSAQHAGVAAGGHFGRADRLVPR